MVLIALQLLAAGVAIGSIVGGIGGLIIRGPVGVVAGAIDGAVFAAEAVESISFIVS